MAGHSCNSVVHISATEATALGPPVLFGQNFDGLIGSAGFTVQNVSPGNGVVDFVVFVDWPRPLNIVTDITIFDPPAKIIIGT